MKEYVIDTLGKRPTERARNRRPPGDKCNQEDKCDQGKQDKQVAGTGGLIKETAIGKISTFRKQQATCLEIELWGEFSSS